MSKREFSATHAAHADSAGCLLVFLDVVIPPTRSNSTKQQTYSTRTLAPTHSAGCLLPFIDVGAPQDVQIGHRPNMLATTDHFPQRDESERRTGCLPSKSRSLFFPLHCMADICHGFGVLEIANSGTMVFAMVLETANSSTMVFAMVLDTANSGTMVFAMVLETATSGTMVFAMVLAANSNTPSPSCLRGFRSPRIPRPRYLLGFQSPRIPRPCYLRGFQSPRVPCPRANAATRRGVTFVCQKRPKHDGFGTAPTPKPAEGCLRPRRDGPKASICRALTPCS